MPSLSCAGPVRISASVAAPAGVHTRATRQIGMERGHAPVVAAAGGFVRGGKWRADHHGIGAARDGLGDVAAGTHAAIGDDMHVHAGFVEVADPSTRGVGDRGGLRHADAEHTARRARVPRTDTHEHTHRARAHEVQRGGVGRAAAHDDRDVELTDELLQIQRFGGLRHVLGGDDRALDHEDVELGVEHVLGVTLDALRRE